MRCGKAASDLLRGSAHQVGIPTTHCGMVQAVSMQYITTSEHLQSFSAPSKSHGD